MRLSLPTPTPHHHKSHFLRVLVHWPSICIVCRGSAADLHWPPRNFISPLWWQGITVGTGSKVSRVPFQKSFTFWSVEIAQSVKRLLDKREDLNLIHKAHVQKLMCSCNWRGAGEVETGRPLGLTRQPVYSNQKTIGPAERWETLSQNRWMASKEQHLSWPLASSTFIYAHIPAHT